jgi:hypothetical protein
MMRWVRDGVRRRRWYDMMIDVKVAEKARKK